MDLLDQLPFATSVGIVLVEATPERVSARLDWAPERCTSGGILHGGALMTLADTVGGICAFLNLPEGAGTATIQSSTNFLRPIGSGAAHAEAVPLHRGNTTIVVETSITDDQGRLVARCTQSQAVLRPR